MPPEHKDHDQDAEIDQRPGVDEFPTREKSCYDRKRDGGDYGSEGNVAGGLKDDIPNEKNARNRPRHETKECTGSGRYAFAPFEAEPDREHVPDDRHHRGKDRDILRVGLRRGPIFYQEKREPNRGEAFEDIDRENWITPSLSQDAQNICRTDVSTSLRTNVNPGEKPCEISRGKRPKKITDGATGYDQGPHGFLFAARLTAG